MFRRPGLDPMFAFDVADVRNHSVGARPALRHSMMFRSRVLDPACLRLMCGDFWNPCGGSRPAYDGTPIHWPASQTAVIRQRLRKPTQAWRGEPLSAPVRFLAAGPTATAQLSKPLAAATSPIIIESAQQARPRDQGGYALRLIALSSTDSWNAFEKYQAGETGQVSQLGDADIGIGCCLPRNNLARCMRPKTLAASAARTARAAADPVVANSCCRMLANCIRNARTTTHSCHRRGPAATAAGCVRNWARSSGHVPRTDRRSVSAFQHSGGLTSDRHR
ncbi:hypothetical protein FQR65_LT20029 [Abscondita terminalis]|nr:hypothetical protein FQR65_LT20029 [Abscondita terminalis]